MRGLTVKEGRRIILAQVEPDLPNSKLRNGCVNPTDQEEICAAPRLPRHRRVWLGTQGLNFVLRRGTLLHLNGLFSRIITRQEDWPAEFSFSRALWTRFVALFSFAENQKERNIPQGIMAHLQGNYRESFCCIDQSNPRTSPHSSSIIRKYRTYFYRFRIIDLHHDLVLCIF